MNNEDEWLNISVIGNVIYWIFWYFSPGRVCSSYLKFYNANSSCNGGYYMGLAAIRWCNGINTFHFTVSHKVTCKCKLPSSIRFCSKNIFS